jgi:tripartite-type tricarboxylate transporter receptor subunit TctC
MNRLQPWPTVFARRALVAFALAACTYAAGTRLVGADTVSFSGKTVNMVIGYAPGGGTDVAGRLIASFLGKHLPGAPTIVVQNVPGADGMTAMNYFVQQVKPDGLTVAMGSASEAEPTRYRNPQSHFDPTAFAFVGGIGRGGSALVINKQAQPRLAIAHAPPVIMGSTSGAPRSNMEMAAWGREFLGWNLKWVIGYRGTSDLFLALERGEIDMSATGNLAPIEKLVANGKFAIAAQTGFLKDGHLVTRAEFGDAPLLTTLIDGHIGNPVAADAFAYWTTIHAGPEKWVALPPGTPAAVVDTYREAFRGMVGDPEFIERSRKLADDLTPISAADVESWIKVLGRTSADAIRFPFAMMRRQGATAE